MTKKIDESTLAILSKVTIEGNTVSLTCGQLDRKQYLAVNKIIEIMGGKWSRKAKGHVFDGDPTDKLEAVLLTGEIMAPQDYGYYPTPPDVVNRLVELADIRFGIIALEPSAGQGAIADVIQEICAVDCIEILPENTDILKNKGHTVWQKDFLDIQPSSLYDRVIMFPPFAPRQIEINHVLHAWNFLKPGGRLVSVMSTGVLFRENRKTVEFRDFATTCGRFERLPENSFKSAGTGVNTCIVALEKPEYA